MVWFYTRDQEKLTAETRFDNDTQDYVLVLNWPDGRQATERFSTVEAFQERLNRLRQELESEKWSQSGPPVLLADGWPDEGGGGPTLH